MQAEKGIMGKLQGPYVRMWGEEGCFKLVSTLKPVYPDRCKVRWEGILSILFKSVGVSKRTSLYSVGYTTLLFH